ncbi:MAG: lipopolysaccharide biosynthesis protein [Clostridia bacterium]|nr:lipopolysaccharide biosynthesis protein [Clostridia bacterium]
MTNKTVTTNFLWRFLERCGAQVVMLIVTTVLARLLGSTAYGTIALVTVFTTIMQVFIDSGLGTALIQKKDSDDLDFSTVFFFNLAMCTVLYLIMFFGAPLISAFYEKPELTSIIRVLSLTLVISGLRNVQQSYISKKMLFKRFFWSSLGGSIGSAIVGIAMAYMGFGVWALVAQHLINLAVSTAILWLTVKWRPKFIFSFTRLKGLFSFGWKLLISALIDTVYNDLRQLIIGKKYTSDDLAFYNEGRKFPNFIVTNINTSIDSVLLPAMSSEQNDRERVKTMTRRSIKVSSYLMWPLMVGLGVCAEPVIRLLLGSGWLDCAPYMRIFCFTFAFYPIHTANLNAIKAMGRSDMFLKLEILKKVIGLIALFSTMNFGVMTMAYSLLVTTVLSQIINSWPNRKLLGYSYLEQIKDILPSVALSGIMGVCVLAIQFIGLHYIVTLLIQVPLGAAIYIGGSKLFRLESFEYIWNVGKGFLSKKIKSN